MRTFRAHWNGRVFIPDEPVDLPIGKIFEMEVLVLNEPLHHVAKLLPRMPTSREADLKKKNEKKDR